LRIVHLETGTHVYGGALQVLLLVEGLQKRGIENTLVVPEGTELEAEARRRELPVSALPMAGEADFLFPFRFQRLLKSVIPELVHLHSRRGGDTLGGLGARWAGMPVVMTRRVDNPEPAWAVGAKYGLYHRVVTISEAIRKVLVGQGVDPGKIRCVPSALDPGPYQGPCGQERFLEEFGLNADHTVVFMAAQFIPRKGHDVLLAAIPSILENHPGARFLLFGKGPLQEEVKRKVAAAHLEGSVQLPGFREDLPNLLPCADLLVHPATMEGLGVILLQAGAAGLPVVAAASGGIPEAVDDGVTGLLVPPENPEALAAAASELLADPARARAMGKAGRERIRSRFSVEAMVEGNLSVYKELVESMPAGS
jgi:glycosyltransferase involved in cell wall biosynthesis